MGKSPSDILAATAIAVERDITANAVRTDRERIFPQKSIDALAAAGALGLFVPEQYGGAGASLSTLSEACELIGGACASTAMIFLMHSVTTATIAASTGERVAEVLTEIAAERKLGSLAFSERATGAHFYSPDLTIVRVNGVAHVTGRKSFVTSAGHADFYLLLLAADASDPRAGADMYHVPADTAGLRADGEWWGLGMAGNSSVALELDDVLLREEWRLGESGDGTALVFGTVAPYFLLGLAAVNVGIASAAARAAASHAAARRYPDRSMLAEVQFVQHLVADMDTAVRQARLLVGEAARIGDSGDPSALVSIMEAKVAATETAIAVTQKALETTGGQGYTASLPIERHLRDARAGSVMAPTNGVVRSWIGKSLMGLPVP